MKPIFLSVVLFCSTTILFAQNIGIGTATPQERLHVAGSLRVDNDLIAYQNSVLQDSLVVGYLAGAKNARVRVVSGKFRTDALTAGGGGFLNKMFSAYGDAEITGNTSPFSLNVSGDGIVNGNARVDGRIGINGPTNVSYGLVVNNANSYFQGDVTANGNKRVNGRIGINGPTNSNYGLMVNSAHSYLQGSATIFNDAVINGNSRIDGRIGINGSTNINYGLMVNNANSYFQGNLTVSGSLNVSGTSNLTNAGNVSSNGSSSIRIAFVHYHINRVYLGNEEQYNTFDLPEFGPNVDDIRVSVFQYIDSYNDPLYSDPNDIRWWISDINPDDNTARIRSRNLTPVSRALRGDFYILVMIRE